MNAHKHTPGPWHITRREDCSGFNPSIVFGPEGYRRDEGGLYAIAGVNGDSKEDRANARLIAAAPELLEACLAVVQDPYTTCACAEKVRAAIAKATGGTL